MNNIQTIIIDTTLREIPARPFWSSSKIIMIAAGDHQLSPEIVTPGVSARAAMKVKTGILTQTDQFRECQAQNSRKIAATIK